VSDIVKQYERQIQEERLKKIADRKKKFLEAKRKRKMENK
jgi:hypothetical protein